MIEEVEIEIGVLYFHGNQEVVGRNLVRWPSTPSVNQRPLHSLSRCLASKNGRRHSEGSSSMICCDMLERFELPSRPGNPNVESAGLSR